MRHPCAAALRYTDNGGRTFIFKQEKYRLRTGAGKLDDSRWWPDTSGSRRRYRRMNGDGRKRIGPVEYADFQRKTTLAITRCIQMADWPNISKTHVMAEHGNQCGHTFARKIFTSVRHYFINRTFYTIVNSMGYFR